MSVGRFSAILTILGYVLKLFDNPVSLQTSLAALTKKVLKTSQAAINFRRKNFRATARPILRQKRLGDRPEVLGQGRKHGARKCTFTLRVS